MHVENPSGHTAARARPRAHTQTEAKKTQTDRQTGHTQADNMRKNPSKSTNMKESAEADRYEGASAATHNHVTAAHRHVVHTQMHGTDARRQRRTPPLGGCTAHARHTHLRVSQTELFSL